MHTFFCNTIQGNTGFLEAEEAKHATRVLRLKSGDQIRLLDGKGTIATAAISFLGKSECGFTINEMQSATLRKFPLHIAIAPTKLNDRFEWLLEKAVELGVESITPVICDHSIRRTINYERMHRIVIAAAKQSVQPFFPLFQEAIAFKDFIFNNEPGFIALCTDDAKMELVNVTPHLTGNNILIGPEGDFSAEEIRVAIAAKWQPIKLGQSRLRTETAGIYAAAVFRGFNS